MAEAKHTLNYNVTADGRVFSTETNWRGYGGREMGQCLNASGYPSVRIIVDGRRKRLPVHRLVAETHIGPKPSPDHEVCHIDGDKTNNSVANLRWGTRSDNAADRDRHGRTSRGAAHAASIIRGIRASTNPYWRHAR